jgi:hypothetical protein
MTEHSDLHLSDEFIISTLALYESQILQLIKMIGGNTWTAKAECSLNSPNTNRGLINPQEMHVYKHRLTLQLSLDEVIILRQYEAP